MKIAPLDITQKQFKRVLRGLDTDEVQSFLTLIASELEDAVKDLLSGKDELKRKEGEIADLRSRERMLQETMVTTQKACEGIRDAARKDAEIIVSEAELEAERIVANAHARFVQMVEDINELKRQRVQFEAGMRSLVEGHLRLLETFQPAREQGVEFLPQKKRAEEG